MILRVDYLDNRLQRVEKNLAFLKEHYSALQDEDLKESIQRVYTEYLELIRSREILNDYQHFLSPDHS